MRLTLRTLLAYLDDMLEPAQAKVIGQKAAESDSARELMERIQQVTRRRRLTTPPQAGAGSIDANTIAEYLDNVVDPEQAAEVEQVCLASDVHLAEVAACHQILTLVLGEPAVVPPSANQRMYGLVKGPESIPFRKPASASGHVEIERPDHKDHDETLRLGMPPVGKEGWSNRMILYGGGVAAAVLLAVAIWQVLQYPWQDTHRKGNNIAQNGNKDKAKNGADDDKKDSDKDKGGSDKKNGDKKEPDPKDKKDKDKKDNEVKDPTKVPPPVVNDIPYQAPDPRQAAIGQLLPWETREPAILLQAVPEGKAEWKRLGSKNPEVISARPLVALPGSRAKVETNRGVELTLWGSAPDLFVPIDPKQPPPYPLLESLVELYQHEKLDLDLFLRRGRIVLANTSDKPKRVRVRFENPTKANASEFFDITLESKDTSILVDRIYQPSEPFYSNPKHPNRLGPLSSVGNIVLGGTVFFRAGDLAFALEPPPGRALISWNSAQGLADPRELPALPSWVQSNHLPKEKDSRIRKDFLKARDFLGYSLSPTKSVDVALEEAIKSSDLALRALAVRCRAALDDLPSLLDALDQEKAQDLRREATVALERWIAAGRDHDYKLFDFLKERYRAREAEIIMELLHPPKDLARPETYELWIDCLVSSSLVIRELGYSKLQRFLPQFAKDIPYLASADSTSRTAAFNRWRQLIPSGQLPPQPKKM